MRESTSTARAGMVHVTNLPGGEPHRGRAGYTRNQHSTNEGPSRPPQAGSLIPAVSSDMPIDPSEPWLNRVPPPLSRQWSQGVARGGREE